MWLSIFIISWIVCAILGYILPQRKYSNSWTIGDRFFTLLMALFLGPMWLLLNGLVELSLANKSFWSRPAKW
jgi:quinol-cytochrome oxidoreductase complex cytochrome b subunit